MKEEINVYIEEKDHQLLLNEPVFIPIFHYFKHELPQPSELGRIKILGSPDLTIRFHIKKTSINPDVMLPLLEEIYLSKQIDKLSQVIRFLKQASSA